MSGDSKDQKRDIEEYRECLRLLARLQLGPTLQGKIDLSGVVQQTMLEAYQAQPHCEFQHADQFAAWLRRILANNMADEIRKLRTGKRNVSRESRVLDRWLGQWESTRARKPTETSAKAAEGIGISNVAKILDDRFLQSHWMSEDGDEEMLSLLTYDENSAAYRLWTFSSSGATLEFAGQWDDATNTLTLQLGPSAPDVTGTSTTRFVDADTIETSLIVRSKDGVVTRDIQETLTRRSEKAAEDAPPWMGTSALSPELKPLQRFTGSWGGQFVVNYAEWTSEKTTAPLTHKVEWILGGRMIRHRFVLSPPVDLHGLALMAYTPEGNVYRRWDFDSGGGFPRGEDGQTLGTWDEATQTFTWKHSAPNGEISTATNRFIDNDTHDWALVSKDSTGKVLLDLGSKTKRK